MASGSPKIGAARVYAADTAAAQPAKPKGADASHAWFAVYVPGDDWHDFDPTNDVMPADQHITTAWDRDYSDVTPLKGVVFGGGRDQRLSVAVDVERSN